MEIEIELDADRESRRCMPAVVGLAVLSLALFVVAHRVPAQVGAVGTGGKVSVPPPAPADAASLERLGKEIEGVRRENQLLRQRVENLEAGQGGADGGEQAPGEQAPGEQPAGGDEADLEVHARELDERYGASKGGVYSKPFFRELGRRSYLGGYLDLEFVDRQGMPGSFVQHRFVPMIYAELNDQLRVAAEIEFEYGGSDAPAGDGETKVEFAVVDYVLAEFLGFRAGAILSPLGKFNLIHDSPINDLTDRPLVDQVVIPTTFTEAGLGVFGTFYPLEPIGLWQGLELDPDVKYEAYVVNGFRGLVADAAAPTGFRSLFNDTRGLRAGRDSLRTDANGQVSGVGRLSVSPFIGLEAGASVHAGTYDDRGDNLLVIYAFDCIVTPFRLVPELEAALRRLDCPLVADLPALEIQAEVVRAEISRDSLARQSGVPDDLWGYYLQANYHFMFDVLRENLGAVFRPESVFTAVVRLDQVELDANRSERITFGVNFRPWEETVFKLDYQLNFEDWSHTTLDNDAFLFSVATYF